MEVLAVVAIVAVLMGFLLPTLNSARKRAAYASDISAMRQLGQAAILYAESSGGFPRAPQTLVAAGLIPKVLCSASSDPDPEGFANRYAAESKNLVGRPDMFPPFRQSYITPAYFNFWPSIIEHEIDPMPRAGWLVHVSIEPRRTNPVTGTVYGWSGPYLRLLYDGAVVRIPDMGRWASSSGRRVWSFETVRLFRDDG